MSRVIAGARELAPFQQGSLTRLCGLYAILNAAQLAFYPDLLTPHLRQRLFVQAVVHLARKRLLRRALCVGIDEDVWLELGRGVFSEIAERTGVRLAPKRILVGPARTSRKHALRAIAAMIDQGWPILVCMDGALDHYTVISGYTDRRLRLFDSLGLKWLAIEGVAVGVDENRRHWMAPASTYAVVRAK